MSDIKDLAFDVLKHGDPKKQRDLKLSDKFTFPLNHLVMLTDVPRLEFYSNMIAGQVKDRIVLDVGTGNGVLTYFALKHGARKVYAVEFHPVMQGVFKANFEKEILAGKVVLIEKDAALISDADFPDEKPEVIVHEIFGHNPLAENVIKVFEVLSRLSFYQEVTLLPRDFEILVEPVCLPHLDGLFELDDYEDFPLSKLSVFVPWSSLRLAHESIYALEKRSTGPVKSMLTCNLMDPIISKNYTMEFEASAGSTHLCLWMKIFDSKGGELSTSHFTDNSHWQNIFFPLSSEVRELKRYQIDFSINGTDIVCLGLNNRQKN